MAIQAIANNLLPENVSPPSAARNLASDLNQMSKDLATSNWPAAEEDYVRFTEDEFEVSEAAPAPQPESDATGDASGQSSINLIA